MTKTKEDKMKTYVGTKIVSAEPEIRNDLNYVASPGYKIVYEDGYTSWSPKDVFERCYREVTTSEASIISDNHTGECCDAENKDGTV